MYNATAMYLFTKYLWRNRRILGRELKTGLKVVGYLRF